MGRANTNVLWRKQIFSEKVIILLWNPPYDTLSVRSECPQKVINNLGLAAIWQNDTKKVINKLLTKLLTYKSKVT